MMRMATQTSHHIFHRAHGGIMKRGTLGFSPAISSCPCGEPRCRSCASNLRLLPLVGDDLEAVGPFLVGLGMLDGLRSSTSMPLLRGSRRRPLLSLFPQGEARDGGRGPATTTEKDVGSCVTSITLRVHNVHVWSSFACVCLPACPRSQYM